MRQLAITISLLLLFIFDGYSEGIDVSWPVMKGVRTEVRLTLPTNLVHTATIDVEVNGQLQTWPVTNGVAIKELVFEKKQQLSIRQSQTLYTKQVNPIPLWLSVLPPLIAIAMALFFKEVYLSLFSGLFSGTFILFYYKQLSVFEGITRGLFSTVDTYFVAAMKDTGHISIIVFSLLIGGMVSIIHKNGGMSGLVSLLARYARSPRSGQFITWCLGIFIFFDDYANTLVVGNTMRPVTDRLKVSREKLAYIVDSTAAPIASIAFVTTWIGAELSYIKEGLSQIGIETSAYRVFIDSIQYSFYPILTIIFVLLLIVTRRDFGTMYNAEVKARFATEKPDNEPEIFGGSHWTNGVLPVLIVVFGTIAGLIITGYDPGIMNNESLSFLGKISEIIGNSDSYTALLWSSLGGLLVAIGLTVSQKTMTITDTMDAMLDGFKSMLPAVMVLVLAWSLAQITGELHTATFMSQVLTHINMPPWLIPALTFIISAIIAFSTGSSWGTMAILYPLILPAAWLICLQAGLEHDAAMAIFVNVVSSVLAGSVLGDHCSPISDTTIMSSLACDCNHLQHVKTQLPYALFVGAVSVIFGSIPGALGIPVIPLFVFSSIFMYIAIRFFGKTIEDKQR
jgi:Na+/H+ antiporter NhaC